MGGACCLHDRGVQKLTLNMLCPFLTSPVEGRPQHYITTVSGEPIENLLEVILNCGIGSIGSDINTSEKFKPLVLQSIPFVFLCKKTATLILYKGMNLERDSFGTSKSGNLLDKLATV